MIFTMSLVNTLKRTVQAGLVGLVLLGQGGCECQEPKSQTNQEATKQKTQEEILAEYAKLEEEVLAVVEIYATKQTKNGHDSKAWIIPEYENGKLAKLSFGYMYDDNMAFRFGAFTNGTCWEIELGKEFVRGDDLAKGVNYRKEEAGYIRRCIKTNRTWVERFEKPDEKEIVYTSKANQEAVGRVISLINQFDKNYKPNQ